MISLVNDSEKRTKNPLQVDAIDRNEIVVWVVVFACSTEAQYDRTQILYGIMKAAMTFSLPPCNDWPSSREWFNSTMQRRAKRDGTTISLLPFTNILRQWTTIFWNCKNYLHIWRLMKLSIPNIDESAWSTTLRRFVRFDGPIHLCITSICWEANRYGQVLRKQQWQVYCILGEHYYWTGWKRLCERAKYFPQLLFHLKGNSGMASGEEHQNHRNPEVDLEGNTKGNEKSCSEGWSCM